MKTLIRIALPALLAAAMTVTPLWAQADKTVATVNGEKLLEQEFLTKLRARYGTRLLNAMISNMAIRQAAKAANVTVPQDELERRFLATQRGIEVRAPLTGENFELWLAKQGLTKEYFLTELYDQMLLEKMVHSQVKVTSADVSAFYQRNKDQIREAAQVRVAHICVKTEKEAEAVRADVLAGKITWDDAAKKYSLDPWTKDDGGDMGFVTLSDSEFHKAAFGLRNNGDISAPVRSQMGIHIIKRIGYKAERVPPFEEVEASITEQLERRLLKELARIKRDEILNAAKVEVVEKLPEEAPPPAAPATPAPAPANP